MPKIMYLFGNLDKMRAKLIPGLNHRALFQPKIGGNIIKTCIT